MNISNNQNIDFDNFVNVITPDFIGSIIKQHCGDILEVIERIKEGPKKGRYICKFIKYPFIIDSKIGNIKSGEVLNPRIEIEEFVNILWPQNCGKIVKVLEKVLEGPNKGKWKIEYQKYPYIDYKTKTEIKLGRCINPLIEKIEFMDKLWPQKCGDVIKILSKTNELSGNLHYYYLVEFQKYKFICKRLKKDIINGTCVNPEIERIEFLEKEWPQNCGDTLIVLEKLNKKASNGANFLYKCQFKNYPYIIEKPKTDVISGCCDNPNLPYKTKESLVKFIKENFVNDKPTLEEVAKGFNVSKRKIKYQIEKFKLQKYIKYYSHHEEDFLRNLIKSIYKGEIYTFHGKKDYNCKELDNFLPLLNIAFEFNGSFWHQEGGDPNRVGYKPIGYHEEKFKYFLLKGILIFNIWDYFLFKDLDKRGKTKNYTLREEAQKYIENVINSFRKRLPQLI